MASPIPIEAPVTTITFPAMLMSELVAVRSANVKQLRNSHSADAFASGKYPRNAEAGFRV
jgi:hypothetical protein